MLGRRSGGKRKQKAEGRKQELLGNGNKETGEQERPQEPGGRGLELHTNSRHRRSSGDDVPYTMRDLALIMLA